MITAKRYTAAHQTDWDHFIQRSKNGHFMFQRKYMEYHADRFSDHSLLFHDEKKLLAVLPANSQNRILYSHQGLSFGGLVLNSQVRAAQVLRMFDSLLDYLRSQQFSQLQYKPIPHIYHRMPAEEDLYALFRFGAIPTKVTVSTTIDMTNPGRFSSGKKSGVVRARREGINVRQSNEFEPFFAMVKTRMREKYDLEPTHTAEEMSKLQALFPKNIALYGAHIDKEMVAGAIVYVTDRVCHTQYISSNERGREARAIDAIISHLIRDVYQDRAYFDFGNSNEQNGQYLNESLCGQKEEFGGRTTVEFFYSLDL